MVVEQTREAVLELMASLSPAQLDKIKAASPARGYTRRYGSESGPWTTNQFVEAIYKSLPPKKS